VTGKENFIRQNSFGFKPEMGHLTPTVAFTSYWRFIHERLKIYLARLAGKPAPWTEDSVLDGHRFTNTFRVLDRESQACVRIANSCLSMVSAEQALFRILLFKIFNLGSTWDLLCNQLGEEPQLSNWDPTRYADILCTARTRGKKIFSAAYILWADNSPTAPKGPGSKTRMWLGTLDQIMQADLAGKILKGDTLEEAVRLLSDYPGIEDFIAQQYATDFSYTNWFCPADADSFILPGPGSIDGIAKCFNRRYTVGECSDIIRLMRDSAHELSMQVTGCPPPTLPGIDRPMDLIDFQSGFCEVDKYSRVAHAHLNHLAKQRRTKIKTAYRVPAGTLKPLPAPVYPLHWYPARAAIASTESAVSVPEIVTSTSEPKSETESQPQSVPPPEIAQPPEPKVGSAQEKSFPAPDPRTRERRAKCRRALRKAGELNPSDEDVDFIVDYFLQRGIDPLKRKSSALAKQLIEDAA
jgi:alpha-glutamyl/putrescinyl thymine pyrophosphorylase clade 1